MKPSILFILKMWLSRSFVISIKAIFVFSKSKSFRREQRFGNYGNESLTFMTFPYWIGWLIYRRVVKMQLSVPKMGPGMEKVHFEGSKLFCELWSHF